MTNTPGSPSPQGNPAEGSDSTESTPGPEPLAITGALPEVIAPDEPLPRSAPGKSLKTGFILAFISYGLWGFLPLYFAAITPTGAFEILGWRIVFSLILCLILVTVTRTWGRVSATLRSRRVVLTLGLAGGIVSINWLVYIIATTSGHVLEASLGYFINPIATIVLGVVVFHEKLRKLQWAAVGVSLVAIGVLSVEYGSVPWISLAIAGTFALYGLVKKNVGGRVDSLTGLTFETAWLIVPAGVVLSLVQIFAGGLAFGHIGAVKTALLVGTGVITLVPLLTFAGAASRLPLSYVGMVQYFNPIMQFLVGYLLLGEHMSLGRWIGFGIVWIAILILVIDALRAARSYRMAVRASRKLAG
ncbi:EamA family transporter RarD [uncultured Kocuria sp.]|uniref:EamA family transporter RarD n=1 Tax=uncultured Kocuria sp. TaxID=259305 RepID=UPI000ADA2A0C|nr:EamA family transporter RarD [uncultured Kocuria sp.]MCT1366862.1 EamA family transporter RarD [Rothia sp. p3-SID1597]